MLKREEKNKLLFLFGYSLISIALVYIIRPIYLISILIVLMPPAIINFLWLKKTRYKILLFSLLTTLLFAPPVELAARLTDAWDVQSVLPRLFGLAPLENFLFAFFNFFWVLSFYEYFINHDKSGKIATRFNKLILIYLITNILFFSLFFKNHNLVALNYYTLALIILLIPGLLLFARLPKLLAKIWLPTLFFAFVFFSYEAVSLIIGSWWWPGSYLLTINLFNRLLPLDDVIIWYFLSTPVLIAGYEFFVNGGDNKSQNRI